MVRKEIYRSEKYILNVAEKEWYCKFSKGRGIKYTLSLSTIDGTVFMKESGVSWDFTSKEVVKEGFAINKFLANKEIKASDLAYEMYLDAVGCGNEIAIDL